MEFVPYIVGGLIMINHLNSLLIEGVLVNDPEVVAHVKSSPEVKLVKFTIANDYFYVGTDGGKKKDTLFIAVQTWGALAERCLVQMKKGMTTRCVGKLKQRNWETESGDKHSVIELVAKHIEYRSSKKNAVKVLDAGDEEEPKLGESEVFYVI